MLPEADAALLGDLLGRWESQRERGRDTPPEELCPERPDLIEPLRARIAALRAVDGLLADVPMSSTFGEVARANPPTGPARTASSEARFGDLKFHARGGLGEVYLARNLELGRNVALKFIRREATTAGEALRRFRREAEVTARLEHPGIVPIYGVGHDDAGRPCYSMRFIRGRSLRDAITEHHGDRVGWDNPGDRNRAFRGLLSRFRSVCATIAYAHSRSVLHRDIKPGNVMLGEYDETLVVDWGLARDLGASAALGGDELAEGDAESATRGSVGTPGFMSPEQQAGDWVRVGPASDVYSLGATLFCILTGRSPFQGLSTGELLRRVERGEFLPPRHYDPSLPSPLEAICLKAMALLPRDRYASALELAADLDAYLADDPVSAYREGPIQSASRWLRRHRTWARAMALTAVIVGITGVSASLLINWARLEERDARRKSAEALAAVEAANINLARQRQVAESNLIEAQANLRLANRAANDFFTRVSEDWLLKVPGLQPLRRSLLELALTYYTEFVRKNPSSPAFRHDLGTAHAYVGRIRGEIGDKEEAGQAFATAVEILEDIARSEPSNAPARVRLAQTRHDLGINRITLGRHDEAIRLIGQARAEFETQLDLTPNDLECRRGLAATYHTEAAVAMERAKPADAAQGFERARELRKAYLREHPMDKAARRDLAMTEDALGYARMKQDQAAAALPSLDAAEGIFETIVKDEPGDTEASASLAHLENNRGNLLARLGRPTEAIQAYERGRSLMNEASRANPKVSKYRALAARSGVNLGASLNAASRDKEAAEALHEACRHYEQLLGQDPKAREYRVGLVVARNNFSNALRKTGQILEALDASRGSCEAGEALVRDHPDVLDYRAETGRSLMVYGYALAQAGRLEEGEEQLRRSCNLRREVVAARPAVSSYQSDLAASLYALGRLCFLRKQVTEGTSALEEAAGWYEKLAVRNSQVLEFRRGQAMSLAALGRLRLVVTPADLPEAIRCLDRACQLHEKLACDYPKLAFLREALGQDLGALGAAQRDGGHPLEAVATFDRAAREIEMLVAGSPEVVSYRASLAVVYYQRGLSHRMGHATAQAIADAARAEGIYGQLSRSNPADHAIYEQAGASLLLRALSLDDLGQRDEAAMACRDAIASARKAVELAPKLPEYRELLAEVFEVMARLQRQSGRIAAAAALAEERAGLIPDDPRAHFAMARELALCAASSPGSAYAERAINALREAIRLGWDDSDRLANDPDLASIRDRDDYRALRQDIGFPGWPFAADPGRH